MTSQAAFRTNGEDGRSFVTVALSSERGWHCETLGSVRLWHKSARAVGIDGDVLRTFADTFRRIALEEGTDVSGTIGSLLSAVRGHFALVAECGDVVLAVVDRVRSIPLVWRRLDEDRVGIAQTAGGLNSAGGPKPELDPDQVLSVAMAGYSIGTGTLYRNTAALLPGQYVLCRHGRQVQQSWYHRFRPWMGASVETEPATKSISALHDLTLDVLKETVLKADGRMIAVPLSAGLDSRLIASALKHLEYKNVVCFAYGIEGNHEAQASKEIAARLGYPWHFVSFDNRAMARSYRTRDHDDYLRYADSLTGVFFPQDYLAVTSLLDNRKLAPDSMVVNGQSGDFITGNHIPDSLARLDAPREDVVGALLSKHFKQWRALQTTAFTSRIQRNLEAEFELLLDEVDQDDVPAYALYEMSEFVDRQSKYVVNGQRLYEYLGLDWDLPLWHDDYMDFWERRPLAEKANQRLYREMLRAADWGGVWHNIPVNEKRIRPRWLVPIRFLLKALHAPLGRQAWHEFERRYLEYHLTALCGYAVRSWTDIATDARRPWTAVAPHIEDYLHAHGADIPVPASEGAHGR